MLKALKIILLTLAIGIFIIPKQIYFAQPPAMSCCKKISSNKDCCKAAKEKTGSDSKKNKKDGCQGNCDSCSTCASCYVFSVLLNQYSTTISKISWKSSPTSSYQIPFFSTLGKSIWHPPKIA